MNLPLPTMDTCYFCEIINAKNEHWNVINSDDTTITLLNGRQFEQGQCLVVPIRHAPTLLDLTDNEASAVMTAARKISQVMIDVFQPDGVLLYQNNGVGSGQEVPHFHLHVVPRQPGSDWGLGPPHIERLETPRAFDHSVVTEQKRRMAEKLRNNRE